ncbi:MAG: VanW family protein [Defluviitaleaceae bacterium]|nr:VanW family protein [Defluviitaleaceae bacterium]
MSTILRKNYKIIVVAVVIVLLGILIALWRIGDPPGETDRIYTHVYIHGVAVGGMSGEEAEAALMERFQSGLAARKVIYTMNGAVVAEFEFSEFGARFDFTTLVETALEYSHLRGLPRRLRRIFNRTYEINDPPVIAVSAERLEDIMKKLSQTVDVPMQNAAFYEDASAGGKIIVKPESAGYGVNTELAARATQSLITGMSDGTIELEIKTVAPLFTTADFNFSPTILGAFETVAGGGGYEPRSRNISRAAGKIHNSIIFPGEVFSAGEKIAAYLPNSGYESATVLVRGEPVEDVGGGVCQVVTTLYNAALRAELEIVQRHNHSARVSYVDLGFDATVAGNYYDLKIKNSTPHPILITSRLENGSLYVRLHGYETREPGRSLRFEVRQVELTPPEPYREIVDPTIPRGERYVTLESQMGYHVELYKHVYINGREVAQIKINTSIYKPLQGVIAIGAG